MSHSLGNPSLTFTIPSLHDDIDLNCRIYNPPSETLLPSEFEPRWQARGAIVAHPYAPLGGCYDDRIVLAVVQECLNKGLVVGTFNFRGAFGSKSSTSWTGKAELDDYISFAGLMIHYLHTLVDESSPIYTPSRYPSFENHLTPVPSNALPSAHLGFPPSPTALPHQSSPIKLFLAGYSYGSLITTHLPATSILQQRFTSPTQPGSAVSEILARAHSLATETLKDAQQILQQQRRGSHDTHRGRPQVCMVGGEEGTPGSRRLSRDHSGRKTSIDAVRKSVEMHTRRSFDRSRRRLLRKGDDTGHHDGRSGGGAGAVTADLDHPTENKPSLEKHEREHMLPTSTLRMTETQRRDDDQLPSSSSRNSSSSEVIPVHTHYLLISPLLGTAASFATLSLSALFPFSHNQHKSSISSSSDSKNGKADPTSAAAAAEENKNNILLQNPTLVIYGAQDFFTSAKKIRKWCTALHSRSRSHSHSHAQTSALLAHGPGMGVGTGKGKGTDPFFSSSFFFKSEEIPQAGHFWREEGVEAELRRSVREWIAEVLVLDVDVGSYSCSGE